MFDKDVKEKLKNICLEEDYQSDMDAYIDSLLDAGKPIPYEEFIEKSSLIAQRMKQWNKKQ